MGNKHRKLRQSKPKPTIEQFMRDKIARIKAALPALNVTIIARSPTNPDAEIVFSDDDIDGVINTLKRRRVEFLRSRGTEAEPDEESEMLRTQLADALAANKMIAAESAEFWRRAEAAEAKLAGLPSLTQAMAEAPRGGS